MYNDNDMYAYNNGEVGGIYSDILQIEWEMEMLWKSDQKFETENFYSFPCTRCDVILNLYAECCIANRKQKGRKKRYENYSKEL